MLTLAQRSWCSLKAAGGVRRASQEGILQETGLGLVEPMVRHRGHSGIMHERTQRFDPSGVPQSGPIRRPPAAKAGDAGGAGLYLRERYRVDIHTGPADRHGGFIVILGANSIKFATGQDRIDVG
jgi:hypothetical protein